MRLLPINKIVVHHSVGGSWSDILAWHREKGWGDKSAYHFFITEDAQLKTGRAINQPSAGTQSWIANNNGIHICLAGNFEKETPTKEQLNLLARIAHARNLPLVGHRDINPTACPGQKLYDLIPSIMTDFIPKWAEEISIEMAKAGVTTRPAERVENIPLYQLVLLIKKMLQYWKVIK